MSHSVIDIARTAAEPVIKVVNHPNPFDLFLSPP